MTYERLVKLAYNGALERWGNENDKLNKDPNNNITKLHERSAWNELQEIEKILKEIENK